MRSERWISLPWMRNLCLERQVYVCCESQIYFVEGEYVSQGANCVPWKVNMCSGKWICPRKWTCVIKRRIYALGGDYCRGRRICAVKDSYMSYEMNMSRGGRICVAWKMNMCRGMWIYAVGGDCLSLNANFCRAIPMKLPFFFLSFSIVVFFSPLWKPLLPLFQV